jgi:hypothetical protein
VVFRWRFQGVLGWWNSEHLDLDLGLDMFFSCLKVRSVVVVVVVVVMERRLLVFCVAEDIR